MYLKTTKHVYVSQRFTVEHYMINVHTHTYECG